MKNKKAQAWGIDLMIALSIFLFGIIAFYLYALNSPQNQTQLDSLLYEGSLVADNLLSEGSPSNWNEGTVTKLGILSNSKINETKLEMLYNLTESDYPRTKFILGTKENFFINLSEPITIQSETIDGIGLSPTDPTNLVRISRLTIYKNKPVNLEVYVWK